MAIPPKTRDMLSEDMFMQICCVADEECEGRIEWNHALIFQGRRQQVWWSIVPMCVFHHRYTDRPDIRTKVNAIMRERSGGQLEEFEKFKKWL